MERTINEATGMTDAELGAVAVDAIRWFGATIRAVDEAKAAGDPAAYDSACTDALKAEREVRSLAIGWSGREII